MNEVRMEDEDNMVIILHLEEGTGLNLKQDPIIITATLGGNILESEIMPPASVTIFDNNLIWETDRKSVKRMKTENLPIKLKCFSVNFDSSRDFIGYALIPIRGIPILPASKVAKIKPHWHKLIGLSVDWRLQKPELLIYVTITDKFNFNADGQLSPKINMSCESIRVDNTISDDMLSSQQGINICLLQDEGLLQVGDFNQDCHIFIVKVIMKCAINLENMLHMNESLSQPFKMRYTLLGSPSECILGKQLNGSYNIHEKIAIHFRSSLTKLKEYFRKVFYIPIDIFYNDYIVGTCRLNLNDLINVSSLDEFLNKYKINDDTFEQESRCVINSIREQTEFDVRPYIVYKFSLKYISSCEKTSNCEMVEKKEVVHELEFVDQVGGGDSLNLGSNMETYIQTSQIVETTCEQKIIKVHQEPKILMHNNECQVNLYEEIPTKCPIYAEKAIGTERPRSQRSNLRVNVQQSIDVVPPQIIECTDSFSVLPIQGINESSSDVPRTFSFIFVLHSIKFRRLPEPGIWQISISHPKADIPVSIVKIELQDIINEYIEFDNLEFVLYFSCRASQINKEIQSAATILNIRGPQSLTAAAELDNTSLLAEKNNLGVILLENDALEKIAMAQAYVYLEDLGANFNSQIRKFSENTVPKYYFDESLAYKIVEELEEWKLKQQENFLIELKRREINHLAQLSSAWQRKKQAQEDRLAQKLEECNALTTALEDANRTLKERGLEEMNREIIFAQAKAELEHTYTTNLLTLKERARRLEDDMEHQLKLEELRYRELEMNKTMVEQENTKLRNQVASLEAVLLDMRKNLLPKEQLTGLFQDLRLLNERLEDVQKSKVFYKEQWSRIIREVHRMRSETLQQIECQIKQNKTIGMQEILHCESVNLCADRDELRMIKDIIENEAKTSLSL